MAWVTQQNMEYYLLKTNKMKDPTTLSPNELGNSKPKTLADMTPFELAEMDNYQRHNRGFDDDDRGIDLENYYDEN